MADLSDLSVLSLSFYGASLAQPDARLSGALERQRDYARGLRRYVVLVPGSQGAAPLDEGPLSVRPLAARGPAAFSLAACRHAAALHRASPFDILMVDAPHLGALPGLFLRLRLRIPLVVHFMADMAGNPWYLRERLSNYPKLALMKLALRVADVCRVSTDVEVERLAALGSARDAVVNVPFYIDRAAFEAAGERAPGKRALYVGRIGHQKDVATLLRAWARVAAAHPDARLTVAGDGPLRGACEALVRRLGLSGSVTFAGAVPYARVAALYRDATVFVMPSLYEGTCMALHEAAASGLPLVATDTAGAHDFITPSAIGGSLVPVRDPARLAEAIDRLFRDPAAAASAGEQARRRLDAFSRERALDRWRLLLLRAARRSGPA